jgi:hypothetical protein
LEIFFSNFLFFFFLFFSFFFRHFQLTPPFC